MNHWAQCALDIWNVIRWFVPAITTIIIFVVITGMAEKREDLDFLTFLGIAAMCCLYATAIFSIQGKL